jgi:hypothetical protein
VGRALPAFTKVSFESSKRKPHLFKLALEVPYGTVLGVFTFIVLCRDRVAGLFARAR